MAFKPKLPPPPPPLLSLQGLLQQVRALEYAVSKIQHDHTQILIWISNTRKRLLEQEIYNNVGEYKDSEPVPFTDGCPKITLRRKTKPRATPR